MGPRFRVDGWQRELTYHEYLQTAAWWKRRERILARASGTCEHCRVAEASQVHHRTYERLGKEEDGDLVALCDPCHRRCHEAELPPVYPYAVSANGWPWPWATIWLAYQIDPRFRAEMDAIMPPDDWPDLPRSFFAMDIADEARKGLARLGIGVAAREG